MKVYTHKNFPKRIRANGKEWRFEGLIETEKDAKKMVEIIQNRHKHGFSKQTAIIKVLQVIPPKKEEPIRLFGVYKRYI